MSRTCLVASKRMEPHGGGSTAILAGELWNMDATSERDFFRTKHILLAILSLAKRV